MSCSRLQATLTREVERFVHCRMISWLSLTLTTPRVLTESVCLHAETKKNEEGQEYRKDQSFLSSVQDRHIFIFLNIYLNSQFCFWNCFVEKCTKTSARNQILLPSPGCKTRKSCSTAIQFRATLLPQLKMYMLQKVGQFHENSGIQDYETERSSPAPGIPERPITHVAQLSSTFISQWKI